MSKWFHRLFTNTINHRLHVYVERHHSATGVIRCPCCPSCCLIHQVQPSIVPTRDYYITEYHNKMSLNFSNFVFELFFLEKHVLLHNTLSPTRLQTQKYKYVSDSEDSSLMMPNLPATTLCSTYHKRVQTRTADRFCRISTVFSRWFLGIQL